MEEKNIRPVCQHNPAIDCPCPKDCPRHGKCCQCVAHHREHGNLPICLRGLVNNAKSYKEIVSARYSCKKYSSEQIGKEQLDAILEAGRLAPTAKNQQEQHVYVLQSDSAQAQYECDVENICPDDHHPHAIDLGLSVKLACCNVGAEKPEDCGDYFAWGETQPKSDYSWSTYKYCKRVQVDGDVWDVCQGYRMTKYCTDSIYGYYGFTDDKTVLEPIDDAARANWGGSWRMPTNAEFQELIDKCTWTWTTVNGKEGYKVTSKQNGNIIFLPVTSISVFNSSDNSYTVLPYDSCGNISYPEWIDALYAAYMSSSLATGKSYLAYGFNIYSDERIEGIQGIQLDSCVIRNEWNSVRPVFP